MGAMAEPIRKAPPEEQPIREARNVVGTPFRRVDGRSKVAGATRFAEHPFIDVAILIEDLWDDVKKRAER